MDEWVSIAGPNHGTSWAYGCFFTSPRNQMIPGSSFLNQLNSGDETPGSVRYGTWWSPCDELINPDTSTVLSGATNTQTSCLSHSGIKDNATTYAQERDRNRSAAAGYRRCPVAAIEPQPAGAGKRLLKPNACPVGPCCRR